MPSKPSEIGTETSSDDSASARDNASSTTETGSLIDRLLTCLSAYPLYFEALFASVSLGLAIIAAPIVIFGMFVALGGESLILEIGAVIMIGSLCATVSLAVALLIHAYYEVRQYGLPRTGNRASMSLLYDGTRAVETAIAIAVLSSLIGIPLSASLFESIPRVLWMLLGGSSIMLPVIVLTHAIVAFGGAILRPIMPVDDGE